MKVDAGPTCALWHVVEDGRKMLHADDATNGRDGLQVHGKLAWSTLGRIYEVVDQQVF